MFQADSQDQQLWYAADETLIDDELSSIELRQAQNQSTPPNRRKLWALIGGIGVLAILLVVVAFSMLRPSAPAVETVLETSPSPVPVTGPYSAVLSRLRANLQAADPSQQDLPFPVVDMEIHLDEPQRN